MTARVAVNHIWLRHFGAPLVDNVFDFGMQTPEPLHADLLDFLASDFQDKGYDLKSTLRLITTSRAYQGRIDARKLEGTDPEYRFAGPRARRLTAEQFVDAIWQLTGTAPAKFDAPIVRGKEIAWTRGAALTGRPYLARAAEDDLLVGHGRWLRRRG